MVAGTLPSARQGWGGGGVWGGQGVVPGQDATDSILTSHRLTANSLLLTVGDPCPDV